MKRKINLVGTNTLTISLPTQWATAHGVKKGDEIDVVEKGPELIINAVPGRSFKRIVIDLTNCTSSIAFRKISAAYRTGYEEIKILYNPENRFKNTSKYLLNKSEYMGIIDLLRANELIGMEVIEQGQGYIVLKELGIPDTTELNSAIKRLFLLALNQSTDSLENKRKNTFSIENSAVIEIAVNKFTHFCLRLLNKKTHEKEGTLYGLVLSIEDIGDMFWEIAQLMPTIKKLSPKTLQYWETVNDVFKDLMPVFFRENNEKEVCDLFMKNKAIRNTVLKERKGPDANILDLLYDISSRIREIIQAKLEMMV